MRIIRVLVVGSLAVLMSAGGVHGAEILNPPSNEPHNVNLLVGEVFQVCPTGLIICPAVRPMCADPKIALPVDTPEGLGFKAVGAGTTLCTAYPPGGRYGSPHPVFRINVHETNAGKIQ